MRNAKLALLEEAPAYRHPYFWAPFIMIGEAHAVLYPRFPWTRWTLLLSVLGLLSALALFLSRRRT